jgi:DNA-binding transcriptional ArsR family regulator
VSLLALSAVRTLPERGIELNPRDRFVLYALADYADERLRAWPSYSTLASWTGYARSTIAESLAALEAAGLITSEQRLRDNGSHTSKIYELAFARGAIPAPGTPPVREPVHPRPGAGTPPVREADPQNHQIEPPVEPPPPSPPDAAIARELEEAEARARGSRARTHDRAVLATAHPKVWTSLARVASSKRWSTEQLHAVARRVLELTRDHGDDPVDELLREILLNLAEIRSPIAYLERALEKRAARPAPAAAGVDLDAIFGRTA